MIKLIVSDFDGVIADCKEIHYKSLNLALESVDPKYIISREDHLKTFEAYEGPIYPKSNFNQDDINDLF